MLHFVEFVIIFLVLTLQAAQFYENTVFVLCTMISNNRHIKKHKAKPNTHSTPSSSKIRNVKLLAIFCGCTAAFVSDLVRNSDCWFSHAKAQIVRDHTAPNLEMSKLL